MARTSNDITSSEKLLIQQLDALRIVELVKHSRKSPGRSSIKPSAVARVHLVEVIHRYSLTTAALSVEKQA